MSFNTASSEPVGDRSRSLESDLHALYGEPTGTFDRLAVAAGLDPARDFRNRDLRTVNFVAADLRGFDLSGSDLTGTGLRHASRADATTRVEGAVMDDEDREWLLPRRVASVPDGIRPEDFRRAMSSGELALVFQPKIDLRRGEVTGVEALCRWLHPERGAIAPAEFIPAAELSGMIDPLTVWTLERASEAGAHLASDGVAVPISVNLSPDVLHRPRVLARCEEILRSADGGIGLEFPEIAVLRDPDGALAALGRLAAAGAPLAIDEYGAGLSSIAYLRRIPAGELKIDQMFIRNLNASTRDPLVVRSTIDLAHSLEMRVTAVGVETPQVLSLLAVMGCDAAQGFLIGRPSNVEGVSRAISDARRGSGASVRVRDIHGRLADSRRPSPLAGIAADRGGVALGSAKP